MKVKKLLAKIKVSKIRFLDEQFNWLYGLKENYYDWYVIAIEASTDLTLNIRISRTKK